MGTRTGGFLAGIAAAALLAGCTPVGVMVAGATGAGLVAAQERSVGDTVDDAIIKARISDLWFRENHALNVKLTLTVNEGRVLITGVVDDPEMRLDAVRLAWQVNGVKEVINEIQVAESGGLAGYAKDSAITADLKARMLTDREIDSLNYSIETVAGTVYLMGIARDQAELDRVIETARNIRWVNRVVSYVRLKDQREGQ
jgi:osmotically-inducible protein OsmY